MINFHKDNLISKNIINIVEKIFEKENEDILNKLCSYLPNQLQEILLENSIDADEKNIEKNEDEDEEELEDDDEEELEDEDENEDDEDEEDDDESDEDDDEIEEVVVVVVG